MDNEFSDYEPQVRSRQPTSETADTAKKSSGSPDLASQVGNRAFTSLVQRSAANRSQGAGPLDPEIADDIRGAKGGGQVMDDRTRTDMESHLGVDLSGVRVHTGSTADALNRSVQAEAFTTGSDVFFKSGKYAPETTDGRRLLAHELTHVVQQSTGATSGESRVSHPDDPHEQEARQVGDAVAASGPAPTVDRQEAEEEEEMQMSVDRQEAEEEEEMQMSVDRQEAEEEEEMQMSVDREEAEDVEEEVG